MASSSSFSFNKTLQRRELFSLSLCKCFSSSNNNPLYNSLSSLSRSFAFSSSKHKHILQPKISSSPPVPTISPVTINFASLNNKNSAETIDSRDIGENLVSGFASSHSNEKRVVRDFVKGRGSDSIVEEKVGKGFVNDGKKPRKRVNFGEKIETGSGFSSPRSNDRRVERKMKEIIEKLPINNNGYSRRGHDLENRGQKGSGLSSKRSNDANLTTISGNLKRQSIKDNDPNHGTNVKRKKEKMSKKSKDQSPEFQLRIGLDMCSKGGDVMHAISLYDSAVKQGIRMGQYHYTVLLYLCSSAAMGVVRPAKSGSGSRSLDMVAPQSLDEPNDSVEEAEDDEDSDDMDDDASNMKDQTRDFEKDEIRVSDDVKKYALEKGFEIYERMCLDKVQMNEAALTSVARMAMAMGNGDMAFDMVKQMKSMGINPKLRSYGPALSVFSTSGEVEKAFSVEEHMLENGVQPEEPELEALLRVSIQSGKADRVYYLLHKLRTNVRSVSPSTADLIEKWFKSKEASRIGKRKWDAKLLAQTMENVGGGWHGQGWLGRGKWTVSRTSVGADGLCKCCGEKLVLIDLDPGETENFAESVAALAIKREKHSSFQKFQRWLDYYGPFEAVVDAANVGLFSQRKFKPSKVNVVVNGIRQMLPSRKWPLIILHNRRLTGLNMDQPVNKALVDRWRNADALYATPTGSNDDWYWLYAAIKFKCLLVTNDEMRDHTFQLLGNDFFPKWKERHQVRFSFSDAGLEFHMPPPCSVVIQESERGHWHVPIVSEQQSEGERIWLCVTRPKTLINQQDSTVKAQSREDPKEGLKDEEESETSRSSQSQLQVKATPVVAHGTWKTEKVSPNILSDSVSSDHITPIWNAIVAAEKAGDCVIDFHI